MANITIEGGGTTQQVALKVPLLTLGRAADCDVRLHETQVSRHHCRFVQTNSGYKVVDLGGRNGTLVNGERVQERELAPGDRIQVGTFLITYRAEAQGAAPKRTTTRKLPAQPAPSSGKPSPSAVRSGATDVDKAAGDKPPPPAQAKPAGDSQRLKPTSRTTRRAMTPEGVHSAHRVRSSRKAPLIVGAIGAGMLVVGGVLWMFLSRWEAETQQANQVRVRLREAIAKVNELPSGDAIRRDERVEKILKDPQYVHYADDLLQALKREHEKLHEEAAADRAAEPAVQPYLDRYLQLKDKPAEYEAQAQKLIDEAKALFERYGQTNYGDKLIAAMTELKKFMEGRGK